MDYELTTLLITVAAIMASFVAILGGFIASKLISISADRDNTVFKMQSINEEIEQRTEIMNNAQLENDETDSLDLILEHIEELLINKDVKVVYKSEEHPSIDFDAFLPFWQKAQNIVSKHRDELQRGAYLNNSDVPVNIAEEYRNDDFAYEICKAVAMCLYKDVKRQQAKKDPFSYISSFNMETVSIRASNSVAYNKNNDIIKEQQDKINWLEFQRKQLEETAVSLKKPKGVLCGLIIFAIVTVFCIVLPLILCPFSTSDYCCYIITKIVVMVVFVLGLISIFAYLIWLLSWKQKKI